MRYIFLDIDGVLHPATAGTDRQFSPNCLRALRTIVGATGAALILSSSWQSSQAAAEVVDEELARWGLPRWGLALQPSALHTTGGRTFDGWSAEAICLSVIFRTATIPMLGLAAAASLRPAAPSSILGPCPCYPPLDPLSATEYE